METILEEDKDENNYRSPPRSPSFDHGNLNFPTETPTRRPSTCSIDTDNASLSRFRHPDFPGSRLVNMILGSNRELSHSTDSMKDAHLTTYGSPFILKSPSRRRRSCVEPSPLSLSEDRVTAESPLLAPALETETDIDSVALLIANEPPIVFQDKPSEYCAIKIPDLSVVEEECSSGCSRGSSPVQDPGQGIPSIVVDAPPNLEVYQSNSSQESLLTSSDSQSTTSSSHLLKNVV